MIRNKALDAQLPNSQLERTVVRARGGERRDGEEGDECDDDGSAESHAYNVLIMCFDRARWRKYQCDRKAYLLQSLLPPTTSRRTASTNPMRALGRCMLDPGLKAPGFNISTQ